ncbi:receptor-type guanylate cyclase Gyc76C-like [Uloborus diversus]|uniref:receptor-type guanylate cyclase Gyc76C-like n=1 Tax=Uloborus diversus TaxID=327109 RepID=UPI00240A0372|nr:receptor-type guanylate cyclase Gyc76C-like [Uloborus diversus]
MGYSTLLQTMIIVLLLLCGAAAVRADYEPLTVGYLANIHGRQRQGHIISGAMTYAVRRVNERGVLPDNRTLRFVYEDTKGETLPGTEAVVRMWRRGIVAFFGPENSCEVEATVAASLNLPMISYKCADSADKDISNKDYRYHFARTYPPNTRVVSSVLELLRYYKWYKFSIVYEATDAYVTVMRSIERAVGPPFHLLHRRSFLNTRDCCTASQSCCHNPFGEIVEDTAAHTRIYLFLGDTTHLGKFLNILQMRDLLPTGNYMVIYIDLESYTEDMAHKYFRWHIENQYDSILMSAQSLLVVVPTPPRGPNYEDFQSKVREYNREEPFKILSSELFEKWVAHITPYASYLYDAVTLYADALAIALKNNTDPYDGREIMRIFRQRTQYQSVTGAIMRLDADGDAEGNYTVLGWQPTPPHLNLKVASNQPIPPYCMLPVGRFDAFDSPEGPSQLRFRLFKEILWVNTDKPPVDEPPCGFDGSGCSATPDRAKEFASATLASLLFISLFIIYMVYKNWKYEQEIDGLLWRLELEDIQRCGQNGMCLVHSASKMSLVSHVSIESKIMEQIFTQTAVYKGTLIAVKQLRFSKKIGDISRSIKKEMKMMREMHHDNINQFIGACVNPNCVYIVTEYCSKGSLQDILENDDMKLDNMFIASLVFDLIKGMMFLHESDLHFHGNLKSSNCVVTSRWVLQITDFGLYELRASAEQGSLAEHQYYRNLLWKAPELLRFPIINPFGSQKGDVYAFGIILHEIIGRQGPFGSVSLTPKEIVQHVKQIPGEDTEPFRPPLSDVQCQDYIVEVMQDSWHERPESRPDFQHLKQRLRKMREGMKSNIVDHMMAMMEKYAYNLEELVDERTVALVEEKKKTEALLHRMLPKSVANQLMRGEAVIPESFDAVTIYFSDIVGFTEMSASSTPMQVVTFLNDLYTCFDAILNHYDVYKVETIGDAYMVVSGLPIRNDEQHAAEIASMALELLESVRSFRVRHKPQQTLKLRIGIHTGPVCAGVVGLTMPRYCLFGDTVNTASRMESNGEALKIHISPQCKEYLDKIGGYITQERGLVKMKGKGEIRTYWLIGDSRGPKKRVGSTSESIPPQPLFNVHREENTRRRSPKLNDIGRKGSLAGRRNSSYANFEDTPPSPGVPVFLRFSSGMDSPRSPKRLSPCVGRGSPNRLLHPETNRFFGSTASSCGDLNQIDNGGAATDFIFPSPIIRKPKLESIGSEDCDPITETGVCHDSTSNRNGLINLDESLRPLITKDSRVDLILSKDSGKTSSSFLKPPSLRRPSKKWRSCDEIIMPKGSRNSLKDFFTGLLSNKTHDSDAKRAANNISVTRMAQESVKQESLV